MAISKLIIGIVFLILILGFSVFGQTREDDYRESGLPTIQNFRPNDYQAGPNNFSIAQDEHGLLYFANDRGVLVYDGVRWQLIRTPDNTTVRALCFANGRIYVGAQNDLGYLSSDARGQLKFVSLKQHIPEENRDFKGIWEVLAIDNTIFFRSYFGVYRWAEDTFTVWKPRGYFHNAYVVGDDFYVREHKIGLKKLQGDSLQLIPDGEKLVNETFAALWENINGRLTGITRFQGFWEHNGTKFQQISTPADSFLQKSLIFHAVRLPGDKIALATHRRGLALLDSSRRLIQVVGRTAGVRTNIMNRVHSDKQGGLWVAMTNGLARIEMPTPFTYFTESNGLEESTNALVRHNGLLYAATPMGVSFLNSLAEPFPTFEKVEGISHTAWCFLSQPNRLLVGTHRGILSIKGQKAKPVVGAIGVKRLVPSSKDPNRIYIGHYQGVGILEFLPDGKNRIRQIKDTKGHILDLIEDEEGVLWVGTRNGLFSVIIDEKELISDEKTISAEITRYTLAQGLPEISVRPVRINNTLRYLTRQGIYYFNSQANYFNRDKKINLQGADSLTAILRAQEDTRGNIWILGEQDDKSSHICLIKQSDGSYLTDRTLSSRLADLGDIFMIHSEPSGRVWFGGAEGLLRYDPDLLRPVSMEITALVRSVRSINGDTLLFGGLSTEQTAPVKLPYTMNSLRFEYSLPSYTQQKLNNFQVRLDGFESQWSGWQNDTHKDYTGLGPGTYTFHIRAQDAYGRISAPDKFTFHLLPPWYRSWWAYLIYTIILIIVISLIVRLRVYRLQAKTRELETLIAQRTATIRKQTDKLKEMDRVKSRFFANISHEFRTPLTLILGPIDDMLERSTKKKEKNQLHLIQRSAKRLQRLINQLLDLSRLETGKMELQVSPGDFVGFLKSVVTAFASLAESKDIKLKFSTAPGLSIPDFPKLYFDSDKIEKIVSNLLSNAFKFTTSGGTVTVIVDKHQSEGNIQKVIITISDSGRGIPEERLPFIFDRFYQVDTSNTRDSEGTGIGLTLVKELVELHQGQINLKSRTGEGTTFEILLSLATKQIGDTETVSDTEHSTISLTEEETAKDIESVPPSEPLGLDKDETVILVVDDHPDVRRYIREQLQSTFNIVEADNGESGLETAIDIIPDLVISDVMMPKLDGYALCKALKTDQKTSHIPVILLTARAGEEDKLAGLDTGADDYLVKPFNSKELNTRVHNLIEQRRNLRQRYIREGMLRPSDVESTSLDNQFLENLMTVIEEHLQDENFTVEELSSHMSMGSRHLHRKMRALTSKSPVEFIRLVRLQRAHQLLKQKAGSVSQIAYQVGFSNLSYFSKSFKKEFGHLPSEIETNQILTQ